MAIIIPYAPQTWVDGNTSNPVSAARMGVIEEGIKDVSQAPAVKVTHSTTNSITTSTFTALACNTETFDQAGGVASTMHDTVTNNSRLTCRYAGIYCLIAASVTWSASPGNGELKFKVNGTTDVGIQQVVTDFRIMSSMTLMSLAVNDYVECFVFQTSGGTLTVAAGFEFGMVRVG